MVAHGGTAVTAVFFGKMWRGFPAEALVVLLIGAASPLEWDGSASHPYPRFSIGADAPRL
jgi:hypothetical protein